MWIEVDDAPHIEDSIRSGEVGLTLYLTSELIEVMLNALEMRLQRCEDNGRDVEAMQLLTIIKQVRGE
jgi:hypothetical protein